MRFARLLVYLLVALLAVSLPLSAAAHDGPEFEPALTGDEEVPARTTPASGEARFRFRDAATLEFELEVDDIENVVGAHIHCGLPGTNGPIVVGLFPDFGLMPAGLGEFDGRIARGTITAANVTPVPSSAACPGGVATFDELVAKMLAGGTYVNVHTNDGVGATNTGPGDFQSGEIRAQLLPD